MAKSKFIRNQKKRMKRMILDIIYRFRTVHMVLLKIITIFFVVKFEIEAFGIVSSLTEADHEILDCKIEDLEQIHQNMKENSYFFLELK